MMGLPESWILTDLGSICETVKQVDPKKIYIESFKYVDISSIDSNLLKVVDAKDIPISEAPSRARQLLLAGDIVFSTVRTNLKRIAMIGKDLDNQIASTGFAVIRPKGDVSPGYIFYYVTSAEFVKEVTSLQRGASYPAVRSSDIFSRKIPLAPHSEQKRIVAKLDKLFAHLDQLKARLEKIPDLLKQFRQAVLTQAYQGKLTEEWALQKAYTTVEDTLKEVAELPKPNRYASRTASVIPGKFALSVGRPDISVPDRFKWVELVSIARLETGHTPSRKHLEYWDGDICWLGIKDASENHSKTIFDTYQKTNELGLANSAARLLPEGTVCLSRTASVGYVVKMGKAMATSQDFVNWVCSDAIDPDWLKWLLVAEEESIWNFGKGTTHKTVYFPEVIAFHVALPPIEEQVEIVRRVESLFAVADGVEASYRILKEKIDQLPQAILSKAFRGELVRAAEEEEVFEEIQSLAAEATVAYSKLKT